MSEEKIIIAKQLNAEGRQYSRQEDISIDFKTLASQRTFICSQTRHGKSYTIRKIIEKISGKIPIIIFDPEGEYASLREKFVDFLIIGEDGDLPFDIENAEYLAEQTLKHNLSIIIDSGLVSSNDEQEFAKRFLDRFIHIETKAKKSYLIVIEEVDSFAPERGTFKSQSLQSVITLAKKGAKRGIGLIIATQRVPFVSKSVLSQCTNQIIGRTQWIGDLKVIKDYLQIDTHAINKIRNLKPGEFYLKGDFVEATTFAKINEVETTHTGATPDLKAPITIELEKVISELRKGMISRDSDTLPSSKVLHSEPKKYSTKEKELSAELASLKTLVKKKRKSNVEKDGMIENLRSKLTQYEKYRAIIEPLKTIMAKLGGNGSLGMGFDEEYIVKRVLDKIPKSVGGAVYNVSPLEKLRTNFLEEAKNKIFTDIKTLNKRQIKILKFVETQNKDCNLTHIITKCLFLSATSGGTRQTITDACKGLANLELVRMGKKSVVFPNLMKRIEDLLSTHNASKDDIEQVYNHILMEMIS